MVLGMAGQGCKLCQLSMYDDDNVYVFGEKTVKSIFLYLIVFGKILKSEKKFGLIF